MKSDLMAKAPYLKFLKVSSKFIKACDCKSPVHAYCITAQVIINACIYCKKCGCQYKVFVKQEQICSEKLLKLIAAYSIGIIIAMFFFCVLVLIDSYLKFLYFKNHPDEAKDISSLNMFIGADILPNYTEFTTASFSFMGSVRWGILLPFLIMILLILSWLLYYSINDDVLARKKVVYVEVRDKEEDISRKQSKINLKVLLETNKKYQLTNPYNKIWYEKRDKLSHAVPLEGFVFDG